MYIGVNTVQVKVNTGRENESSQYSLSQSQYSLTDVALF